MLKATAGKVLPTTVTGSLPRPSWYTENLGLKSFLDAMVISRFREQYVDALSVYLREQETAGLDIVTDGDCRFDQDVGGQSWTSYPPHHMEGFEATHPKLAKVGRGRHRVSARAHPARLSGSARDAADRRADRARRDAVCGDLQGGAAPDAEAGEVRDGHAGTGGLRGPGRALQEPARPDHGDVGGVQSRNCTTWRTRAVRSSRWKSRRFICSRHAATRIRSSTRSSC